MLPKVRDTYVCDDAIVLVTTDRQSAFDRQLAKVPFKGAVLNQVGLPALDTRCSFDYANLGSARSAACFRIEVTRI